MNTDEAFSKDSLAANLARRHPALAHFFEAF
jgi:hypothetical protein